MDRDATAKTADNGNNINSTAATATTASAPDPIPPATVTVTASTASGNVGWADLDYSSYAMYGSAWIFAVDTMLFPLEVLKTRVMSQRGKGNQDVRIYKMLSTIVRNEVVGSFPGQATYYSTYEYSSHWIRGWLPEGWRDDADPASGFVIHSSAGALAEMFAGSFYVPADLVSQRLQVQGMDSATKYSGAGDVVMTTFRKEGLRGFYRGYKAYIIAYAPGSAIYWGSYETFKKTWFGAFDCLNGFLRRRQEEAAGKGIDGPSSSSSILDRSPSDPHVTTTNTNTTISSSFLPNPIGPLMTTAYVHALSGGCAGFCSCVANNPFDMLRTRIQLMEPEREPQEHAALRRGYWRYFAHVAREEGFGAFYRGLRPRLVVAIPGSVLALSGYEAIKTWSYRCEEGAGGGGGGGGGSEEGRNAI